VWQWKGLFFYVPYGLAASCFGILLHAYGNFLQFSMMLVESEILLLVCGVQVGGCRTGPIFVGCKNNLSARRHCHAFDHFQVPAKWKYCSFTGFEAIRINKSSAHDEFELEKKQTLWKSPAVVFILLSRPKGLQG
jgi:hypothetical protein